MRNLPTMQKHRLRSPFFPSVAYVSSASLLWSIVSILQTFRKKYTESSCVNFAKVIHDAELFHFPLPSHKSRLQLSLVIVTPQARPRNWRAAPTHSNLKCLQFNFIDQ